MPVPHQYSLLAPYNRAALLPSPMSLVVALCALFALTSCGPPKAYKGPARVEAPPPRAQAPVDLSLHGTPVDIGKPLELIGYKTVWIRGTQLLVTLESTAWDEIAGDREGRATFKLVHGDKTTSLTVDEGDEGAFEGFKIRVEHADEMYLDGRGTFHPHAKFTVLR